MIWIHLQIQLVAAVVAIACSLVGVFLVLRRLTLMSDAISHAVVLGIVVVFIFTKDLFSPLLLVGAALTGLALVALVELLERTRLVREDAAIGLVFPLLFSVGVLLMAHVNNQALKTGQRSSAHLDTDCIVNGSLEYVHEIHYEVNGVSIGPKSLYVMSAILIVDLAFILLFFKELKLTTFDAGLAASLGFMPALLHYGLMALVSITAVGAFDAVGAVLVLAFMVAPPATALLLTDRLGRMLILSSLIAVFTAIAGYWLANSLDANIAGSMAAVAGMIFLATLCFAPSRGIVAQMWLNSRRRVEFAQTMLAIHLFNHQGTADADRESRVEHLQEHLRWPASFANDIVRRAERNGFIFEQEDRLMLTELGADLARRTLGSSES